MGLLGHVPASFPEQIWGWKVEWDSPLSCEGSSPSHSPPYPFFARFHAILPLIHPPTNPTSPISLSALSSGEQNLQLGLPTSSFAPTSLPFLVHPLAPRHMCCPKSYNTTYHVPGHTAVQVGWRKNLVLAYSLGQWRENALLQFCDTSRPAQGTRTSQTDTQDYALIFKIKGLGDFFIRDFLLIFKLFWESKIGVLLGGWLLL